MSQPDTEPTSNSEPDATERADASKQERRTALECPECFSHRAEVVADKNSTRIRATCLDCDTSYPIHVRRHVSPVSGQREGEEKRDSGHPDAFLDEEKPEKPQKGKKRSMADVRDELEEADTPNLGPNSKLLEDAIYQGPAGIRQRQRLAIRHAKRFQVEIEDHWRRPTAYLASLQTGSSGPSARACARFAQVWRPKFLAMLSLTKSPLLSARAAGVNRDTPLDHRHKDKEFASMWREAEADAVELLHSRAFQRALEGDCEPVYYMGIRVGYVRKYDSRLQIEMLRAHKPDTFKTAGVQVNIGAKGDLFVLTEEQRLELQRVNREYLESTPPHSAAIDNQELTPALPVIEAVGVETTGPRSAGN